MRGLGSVLKASQGLGDRGATLKSESLLSASYAHPRGGSDPSKGLGLKEESKTLPQLTEGWEDAGGVRKLPDWQNGSGTRFGSGAGKDRELA